MKGICLLLTMALGVSVTGCATGVSQKQNETIVTESTENVEEQYTMNEKMTLNFEFGKRDGAYTGTLKNGLPDGYGTFVGINPGGVGWTYYGEWVNGHFNGNGITEWETGSRYCGDYSNDLMHGTGAYWDDDGTVQCGEFKNDEFIGEKSSNGSLTEYQEIRFGDISLNILASWPMRSADEGWYTYSPDGITNFMFTAMVPVIESDTFLQDNLNKIFDTYSDVQNRTKTEGQFSSGETYVHYTGIFKRDNISFQMLAYDFVCNDKLYMFIFITPEDEYVKNKGVVDEIFASIKLQP